jgi:glycosyltransferase involved in cell wall biosynthesis
MLVQALNNGRLLLYAPNVHTGGGLVLLNALLAAWPADQPLIAWLDVRAQSKLALPAGSDVRWVKAALGSRLNAERSLAKISTAADQVLCFHGLPPLLPSVAKIVVFQQNRNYLAQVDLAHFTLRTRLRLRLEQFISRAFRHRIAAYWVQTPSMANALRQWFGVGQVHVHIFPFAEPIGEVSAVETKDLDFVYVADGEAHKNHRVLVETWIRLKRRGLTPGLTLTLSERDSCLKDWVTEQARTHGLRIEDRGMMSHAEVVKLYARSSALIFPSLSESFGLPLIEASSLGLPILAGEVDFVRDVCKPAHTFDPTSPVSIERAVLRFIGQEELPQQTASAADFLRHVIAGKVVS